MSVYLGRTPLDARAGCFVPLPLNFSEVPYLNDPWIRKDAIDGHTIVDDNGTFKTSLDMTDADIYNFIDPYFDIETDPTPGIQKLDSLFDRTQNPHLDTSTRWVPKNVDLTSLQLEDKCINVIDLNNVSSDLYINIPLEPPIGVNGLCEFGLVLISSRTRRRLYLNNLSSWYGTKLSDIDTGKNSYYVSFQQIALPTTNALTSNWIITATQLTSITQ